LTGFIKVILINIYLVKMSERGSRRNTETSKIEVVQIDGLVVMKLIKHCHEAERSGAVFVQGALLGLVSDTRLEVTHCFPFVTDDTQDDLEFQITMMRNLRQVNIDHQCVGWYQASQFANFLSLTLLESQFSYQTSNSSIEESICLVFDTAKTAQGFVSLKAFLLTQDTLKLVKDGDYTAEAVKESGVSYENLLTEVPIVIKNSHLMNALLLELEEQQDAGNQFLDLGTSGTLETQLRVMMDSLDELNSESLKFNKHQQLVLKQIQEKNKYIQRRQLENKQRIDRNEDPLPNEDLNKIFKVIPPPSRMNPLILSGNIQNTSEEVSEFCSQSMAKLFITEPLQSAKASAAPSAQ